MASQFSSSRPAGADPAPFLRAAVRDLAGAPRIALRLFAASMRGRHRRSLLGYAWLLVPPAAAALICVHLRSSGVFDVSPTALPYPLHVLVGMALWQTFVDAMNAPLQQLTAARQLITRSRVAHEAVILAGMLEVAANAAIRLGAIAIAVAAFGVAPAWSSVLLPVGAVALLLFGTSLGLLAAPWGLLYDDVRQGLPVLAAFWFFLTPVLYPGGSRALRWNPVTPLLDASRGSLQSWHVGPDALIVAGLTVLLLAAGWLIYRLAQPHVVERLA